jgi:preprotein translocase subunit YajC
MTAPGGEGIVSLLIPIILIFAVFYFILILPQQKKEKAHRKMVEGLKKGDEVITIGGIHGRIVLTKDDTVILKVSPQTNIEISKTSIASLKEKKSVDKS